MLIDRQRIREHRGWIAFTLIATAAALAWYVLAARGSSRWPGGSSFPGFVFGVLGGLIILFEVFLWPRKKLRRLRIGRAQTWMRAHLWLGVLTVPLLILHSGVAFGQALSAVLMTLFLVVIASGFWGLFLQQTIPKKMLNELPAETIYSQIDHASNLLREEAEEILNTTCGRVEASPEGGEVRATPKRSSETHVTVGAIRRVGLVQGKTLRTLRSIEPVPGSELLREAFHPRISDFLERGERSTSPLVDSRKSAAIFADLRTKCPPETYEAIAAIEGLCEQRRQYDVQRRLHHWLHGWLWVHLPLSVALVVLMVVHIFVTLYYW